MGELLTVFIISIFLAAISEQMISSVTSYRCGKINLHADDFLYFIMSTILGVFVGLRLWCNDTTTYRESYEMIVIKGGIFSNINWSLGENPGFNALNNILKYFDVSTQSFLMIYALITIYIYLWFLKKYTSNRLMTIFLFFTMGCYTFTMAAIKQCIAVAFGLVAIDRVIERKWKSFAFWMFLASIFHPYALMYLVTPLLTFSPWTNKTFIMLAGFGIVGISLESMLGTIVSITTMMGEDFDVVSFSGEGVNVFRLAVIWAPILLSILVSKFLQESKDRANNIIMNLSMLNAEIMFVALFGTANYFARLANYFLIFQTIAVVWLLQFFNKKSRNLLIIIMVGCYFLYFYYANAIDTPFLNYFSRITLKEYLQIIFE